MPTTDLSHTSINEPIWVLYPWFEEDGPGLIHPSDFDSFRRQKPYGAIFKKCENDGIYTVISRGASRFRVLPELITEIPLSLSRNYDIGHQVKLKNNTTGEIADVRWHYKLKKPMFLLRINGKRKSKRYFPEDFLEVV